MTPFDFLTFSVFHFSVGADLNMLLDLDSGENDLNNLTNPGETSNLNNANNDVGEAMSWSMVSSNVMDISSLAESTQSSLAPAFSAWSLDTIWLHRTAP